MTPDALMISLNVDRDDFAEYQHLGQRWLIKFPQAMASDVWNRIRLGHPTVDTSMTTIPWPGGPIEGGKFDLPRFERMTAKLSSPVETISYLGETDDDQALAARVSWSNDRHMCFGGSVSVSIESIHDDVARLVSFVVDFLDDVDPAFGCVATHFNARIGTELDLALRRRDRESIKESREFLRGYSWLTVVPKELVARLGGIAALREAPLAAVYPLSAGGVVLQASSIPAEYGDVAMRGLFRTVAPVLPPGKPKPVFGYEHIRVVYEDVVSPRPS